MSSKLNQILDVSLDDYIAEKGIVSFARPKLSPKPENFKRQMQSDTEEQEEDDILIVEDCNPMEFDNLVEEPSEEFGVTADKPDLTQNKNKDNRNFVTEEQKRGLKNVPSQQWRLQRQNQVFSKPKGIPPLMSAKAVFDRNTEQLIASIGENAKLVSGDRFFNYQNNDRQHNYRNRNHSFNNRNWQNRNHQGRNMFRSPNFNPRQDRNQQQHHQQNRQPNRDMRDLRALINSTLPRGTLISGENHFNQPQLVTFADMLRRIDQSSSDQERATFADVFRNIMRNQQQQPIQPGAMVHMMNADRFAQMNPNELMPYAANTLFNHITTLCQNFGPKYDMKVQKDIHALQGKAMLYSSAGVVTMDGAGIDNERVKPKTTDMSMNMRFC